MTNQLRWRQARCADELVMFLLKLEVIGTPEVADAMGIIYGKRWR